MRDKFGKWKNNYLKGHRKAKDGQENGINNTIVKRTPKSSLKKARKCLKQWYEINHINEPDYLMDDNIVLNMAYSNYVKANKLKVKASKRIKKQLSAGNGDSKSKRSENTSKKSDKNSDEDVFGKNRFNLAKKLKATQIVR